MLKGFTQACFCVYTFQNKHSYLYTINNFNWYVEPCNGVDDFAEVAFRRTALANDRRSMLRSYGLLCTLPSKIKMLMWRKHAFATISEWSSTKDNASVVINKSLVWLNICLIDKKIIIIYAMVMKQMYVFKVVLGISCYPS